MAKTAAVLRYAAEFVRPEPKFLPLQIPGLNQLFKKGLSRGIIAEISGRSSSGRTSICLHILAQATAAGEVCAVVDTHDSFHPHSAASAGVRLDRIIWVRCHGQVEHAIRATDLLLHAGGFGIVTLDLCGTNARALNRIPLSYWHRFRRAVEHTPGNLIICAESRQAKSCSSFNIELKRKIFQWSGTPPFLLLRGLEINAAVHEASARPAENFLIQTVA